MCEIIQCLQCLQFILGGLSEKCYFLIVEALDRALDVLRHLCTRSVSGLLQHQHGNVGLGFSSPMDDDLSQEEDG